MSGYVLLQDGARFDGDLNTVRDLQAIIDRFSLRQGTPCHSITQRFTFKEL